MMRRGFTVVELAITITVMGILLTLAFVNLNASQANGRDSEREADVTAFAIQLEGFYQNVNAEIAGSGSGYPNTSQVSNANIATNLPDIDPASVRVPGVANSDPISIEAAINSTQTTTGVSPQPTEDFYVYQPINNSDTLCTSGVCRSFNIYYYKETTEEIIKVTSRNQ